MQSSTTKRGNANCTVIEQYQLFNYISPPLQLNPKRKYKLALLNLETYNSIPNITSANNTFVYTDGEKVEGNESWKTITIPEGSYEVQQINTHIQRQMRNNLGENERKQYNNITMGANASTLRAYIKIASPFRVDMAKSTIITTLGFNAKILSAGYHEGENPVNIIHVNSILVNCDIVSGSTLNGTEQPIIYSFFPNVSPGYKIVESPNNLVYLPVERSGSIDRIRVWLTDQNNFKLILRGETTSLQRLNSFRILLTC
jgi:hypothetical protein